VSRLIKPSVRALLTLAAIAAAIALAGCNADNVVPSGRAQAPLSEQTIALIESKNMDKGSPMLVRVFKEEAELEVWKKTRDGQYALLKTYPICRWSGNLGPKKKQGDRQAPEGFYSITPAQMNPNSNYYLAFNTGFPNAYDRSHGYTGSELMVHGDCSSRGCYAMTDKQILEIYALARESFFGGQREFQFEAFPFRMTALNMARHRNNPNFAFWKMLKEGYDDFEATHLEPKVAVCEKRYVFDAAPRNGNGPLNFSPRGKCPAYQLDPQVASVVLEHRRNEQIKMASYIARNVETAPAHVGDGGTNVAYTPSLWNGGGYKLASASGVPGALPHVPNPPGTTIPKVGKPSTEPAATPAAAIPAAATPAKQPPPASEPASQPVVMASVRIPEPAPLPKEGQAPQEKPITIASLIGNLFHQGSRSAREETTASAPTEATREPAPVSTPVALRSSNTEMAAKPKQAGPDRAASAPVTLHPKPQKAEPPRQPIAVAQRAPEPAPIAPVRTEQRAPKPPPIAPVRAAQHVAKPAPIAPVRTAQHVAKPAPTAPVLRKAEKPRAKQVAKAEAAPARESFIRTAYSAPPASAHGLLSGAQPVVAAGSFR
jgi:murein L,D-transpeptidase YafK